MQEALKAGIPIETPALTLNRYEYTGCGMGVTAENQAKKYEISREQQDQFAVLSHEKAAEARENSRFDQEIIPVTFNDRKGRQVTVSEDEHIRPGTSFEDLAKLKPSFKKDGTVTAGNASGINDGAAALVIASESFLWKNSKAKPLARIISWGISGVDPNIMGIGPVPVSRLSLKKAGLKLEDIDLFEINCKYTVVKEKRKAVIPFRTNFFI